MECKLMGKHDRVGRYMINPKIDIDLQSLPPKCVDVCFKWGEVVVSFYKTECFD